MPLLLGYEEKVRPFWPASGDSSPRLDLGSLSPQIRRSLCTAPRPTLPPISRFHIAQSYLRDFHTAHRIIGLSGSVA